MARTLSPTVTRWLKWATIPAALGISAVIVAQSSYAAFSATTSNPISNWNAGTVNLTDDDADTAMFSAANLRPGSTGSRCIVVTSDGSLPSEVRLYSTDLASTNGLAENIDLTIVQGDGGSFGDCTGFTPLAQDSEVYSGTLAAFGTDVVNYAGGVPYEVDGTWYPTGAGPESRTYQVTYTVDPNAGNGVQGGTASLGLTWEVQNSE